VHWLLIKHIFVVLLHCCINQELPVRSGAIRRALRCRDGCNSVGRCQLRGQRNVASWLSTRSMGST